jgi:tungstate transport system ATP-binding protein
MAPIMQLKNVTKQYRDAMALDDVSLKVDRGEILTIIGPNGSGKTTLLRIMAGIEEPTSGEIYFNGERFGKGSLSDVRAKSTMVFQRTALFNTTVQKNIAYGLKLRGYSKKQIEAKVKDALSTVRLEGYEKRLARKLSGGEQQRVSLAMALALNTELLLLDEPTANLDPKNISIIEETISWVNREHRTTVVMATHNMFQAEALTHRAALLLRGRIVQTGTPQEIFGAPSKDLASFARLENVFSGDSKMLGEGTSVIDIGNGLRIEAPIKQTGRVTLFVRPEDIILSAEPVTSSARNMFRGKVVGISDLGSLVKLKVDAGKEFVVQITKRSFVEMGLNLGSEVYLVFKASSVHVD